MSPHTYIIRRERQCRTQMSIRECFDHRKTYCPSIQCYTMSDDWIGNVQLAL